ncbi:hypothetical protein, partial [Microbulbifer sp. TYP-18]|uniref:hypothetical protein n=1 Tax=Microbulbifer sp. TYP-18 TaxID=3230024 RepID=UPI0034C5E70D
TRPAQNAYALASTTNQRVENTQTESVSGSAITNSFTRPPVQPYTYANTAIIAEQFTDSETQALTATSSINSRPAQLEGGLTFSSTALQNIGGARSESETVTIYREHTNVDSTSTSTKLKAGTFTARTASTDYTNEKFHSWVISITVSRTDASLPSGYDGTFSYSVGSRTWDGSVDLTRYFGDNLPAGSYKVDVVASEKREKFLYVNLNPGEPGGEVWAWIPDGTFIKYTYSQSRTRNVGTRIKWYDPSTGKNKITKFYYRSGSGSWVAKSFSASGHWNTASFDNPASGTYSFRVDYLSGTEVMLRGENSYTTIATSNQSKSTLFKAQVKSVSGSSAVNNYSTATNITSIKAVATNQATGQSYTTWTYPQDISGDGFAWNGKINLRIGSKLPNGKYDVALSITKSDGSTSSDTFVYEEGTQYFYDATVVTWPVAVQPDGASVVFKYRSSGSDNWIDASPVQNGANHQATLEVLESGDYEYLIEYVNGNQVVKSATGIFVVNKTGNATDSSSSTANFSFSSTKYVEVGASSRISGYFSEALAGTTSRVEVTVRDKLTGEVVSTASSFPADYLAWLKTENPTNYTYNGNLNLSEDFVRHRFNTS